MNFKTHAPARREGTTLQPNIHTKRPKHSTFGHDLVSWRRSAASLSLAFWRGFEWFEMGAVFNKLMRHRRRLKIRGFT